MAAATISTTDLATALDTNPRTARKFLRSLDKGVGKGSRYALPGDARSIASMQKKFASWAKAQEEAKAAKEEVATESDNDDNE